MWFAALWSEQWEIKAVQKQINSELIEIEVSNLEKKDIEKLNKINVIVEQKINRYSSNNLLSHTIGYINQTDKNGVSGIEKSMNSELKNSNEKYISVFKAGDLGVKNGLKLVEGFSSLSTIFSNFFWIFESLNKNDGQLQNRVISATFHLALYLK